MFSSIFNFVKKSIDQQIHNDILNEYEECKIKYQITRNNGYLKTIKKYQKYLSKKDKYYIPLLN